MFEIMFGVFLFCLNIIDKLMDFHLMEYIVSIIYLYFENNFSSDFYTCFQSIFIYFIKSIYLFII